MEAMNELYSKYKYMETQLIRSKMNMKTKIPDITKALETINFLKTQMENKNNKVLSNFSVCDSIWAQASIDPTLNKVCLWLGAGTIVEYSYDEAIILLNKNLKNAQTNINSIENDYKFLKDQITTTEVNIAKIHNENVRLKKLQKK